MCNVPCLLQKSFWTWQHHITTLYIQHHILITYIHKAQMCKLKCRLIMPSPSFHPKFWWLIWPLLSEPPLSLWRVASKQHCEWRVTICFCSLLQMHSSLSCREAGEPRHECTSHVCCTNSMKTEVPLQACHCHLHHQIRHHQGPWVGWESKVSVTEMDGIHDLAAGQIHVELCTHWLRYHTTFYPCNERVEILVNYLDILNLA